MEKGKGIVDIDDNNCESHSDDCPICFEPLIALVQLLMQRARWNAQFVGMWNKPSLDDFTAHMWPFNELHTPLWSSRTGPNLARLASRGHLSHRMMNDGDDDDDEASSSGGRGSDNSGASSSNGISVRVVRRRNGGSRGPVYGPYH
ncbi:unnamed protein product [Cochlearia groenlandica]